MDETEKRLADAERQIRELTKKVEQLTTIVKPLTSKRDFTDAVKGALREIQRNG